MTDKEKIRKEVEMVVNRRLNLLNGDYFDLNKEVDGFTNEIMDIVDSLQKEPVSDDLEKEVGNYIKMNGYDCLDSIEEVKYIANYFAKWGKNHLWKLADGDDLPEYEREVVVFTQNYPDDAGMMMVAIGHRPTPEGYDGKSFTTGEIKHYTPKTYGKGGWNIPNVKYWLDVELPKEIEL